MDGISHIQGKLKLEKIFFFLTSRECNDAKGGEKRNSSSEHLDIIMTFGWNPLWIFSVL